MRHLLRITTCAAALVALAACGAHRPPATVAAADVAAAADVVATAADTNAWQQRARHTTVTTVTDVTDPAHPVEVWHGGNTIGSCGMAVLMASLGGQSAMPAPAGSGDQLGRLCSSLANGKGETRVPCRFDAGYIAVARAQNADCNGGLPYNCCASGVGNGTCNTPTNDDVITFVEGQTTAGAGVTVAYQGYSVNQSNAPVFLPITSTSLYWDGGGTEGVTFTATADGSTATSWPWCEYAVRSAQTTGCSLATYGNVLHAGWQLNHGVFGTCLTHAPNTIWQISVTITFS